MGTRGAWGFILNDQERITYNHFDSYPQGLGTDLLAWARGVTSWDEVREVVARLRLVDESAKPSDIEQAMFASSSDSRVSDGQDWYSLLRGNQGDAAATLRSGVMTDGTAFPVDSLFCEWAYVFNLDAEVMEVYRGFQKKVPRQGRWAGRPTPEEDAATYAAHVAWCAENDREPWLPAESEYKAVELVATFPLDALPTDAELGQIAEEAYA